MQWNDIPALLRRFVLNIRNVALALLISLVSIIVLFTNTPRCFLQMESDTRLFASLRNTYTLGSDSVPSVRVALGTRQVLDTSRKRSGKWPFNVVEHVYVIESDDPVADVRLYMAYLQKQDWILSTDFRQPAPFQAVKLAAQSKDNGSYLTIELLCLNQSFRVLLQKWEGTMSG